MSYYWHHNTPKFRWHDLLPMRDIVDQKTSAVDLEYDLVFGDAPEDVGGRDIETGYTDFKKRRCWVNAEIIPGLTAEDGFVLTTYVAAHERAHARWTDYVESDFYALDKSGTPVKGRDGSPRYDGLLHTTWNILEDERIERLLGRDFPHLHRYLRIGSKLMLKKIPTPLSNEDPAQVLSWVLRRRVLDRAGVKEKCPLSKSNLALLEKCEPLLDEAFGCSSSRRVVEISREILKILNLDEKSSVILVIGKIVSGQQGERGEGDVSESDGASAEDGELYAVVDASELSDEIKAMLSGTGYSPDVRKGGTIHPAPYADLLREVRPYVEPLRHLFQVPPTKRVTIYEETGARLSIRALKRTPKTPFRAETPPERRSKVALTLVIDDSGSMGGNREHQAKLTALMCNEALSGVHNVRAVLAPSGRVAVDPSFREMSRAYLAGYDSNQGTHYSAILLAEQKRLKSMSKQVTRYLILVADGDTSGQDLAQCRAIVEDSRKNGIHAIGIGIELDARTAKGYEDIFGKQYIDLKSADQLPSRMQAILRRVAHNKRHRGVA